MGVPYQVDNPTVTFFKNGSLLMLGRGGDTAAEAESDGYITAPSWKGPYTVRDRIFMRCILLRVDGVPLWGQVHDRALVAPV